MVERHHVVWIGVGLAAITAGVVIWLRVGVAHAEPACVNLPLPTACTVSTTPSPRAVPDQPKLPARHGVRGSGDLGLFDVRAVRIT